MSKIRLTPSLIINLAAFVCFVSAMAVATVYDLRISEALSDGDGFFAMFSPYSANIQHISYCLCAE